MVVKRCESSVMRMRRSDTSRNRSLRDSERWRTLQDKHKSCNCVVGGVCQTWNRRELVDIYYPSTSVIILQRIYFITYLWNEEVALLQSLCVIAAEDFCFGVIGQS